MHSKTSTSVSQPTDATCLSTKTEKRPEVKKSSEEIQQALKNDQLAKIPLKKRGMKFSEDFDKTSSVIVTNPLPAPLREIPKILPNPEPANKVVNDHVNGEVKATSEKHPQKISDPLADKERLVESVESKEQMGADESERKDEKGQKDLTSAAEKITEATPAVHVRSPNVLVNKENVAAGEKAEPLPALGVIKTASANHHTQDKASESKPADVRESCIVANVPRETDKSLATEMDKSLMEKKQSEGTKMLEVEEMAPKQVAAEETAETPRLNEAKPDGSGEKPKVKTTTVEKQHREKDQSEASVDSEKTQSSPGATKKTVEEKDHGKKQDVAPTSEKDEVKIGDESEETPKKSEETPAETSEKQQKDEIKDDSTATQKKSPEEPQPVEKQNQVIIKQVNIQDDGKQSDSKAEAMEVEEAGSKRDRTESQVEDKAETALERSEGKNETPRNVSKEEDPKTETAQKEEKMECEEQAKPTEVEQSLSEVKPSNGEGANEPKDQETLTNDSEKRPREDKEAAGTDRPITGEEKGTETKAEQNDRSKTLTDPETVDGPLKEKTDTEKTAVEEKKEDEEEKKAGDEKEVAAKEVTNGVKAPVEATSQKGKRPVHRRRAEVQREERTADSESDSNTGMSLRRSPRISRPTAKAVEISDKKQERAQTEEKQGEDKEGEEEEEAAAAVEKVVQRKPREKKADQDGQTKPKVSFPFFHFSFSLFIAASANFSSASLLHRSALNRLPQGRKRRKVRWSNTRTRRKKRGSEEEEEVGSDGASSEDDDSEEEEEDDSDEDYKVERSRKRRNRNRERRSSDSDTSSDDDLPPNDDPCKHCGLPNHPELVSPVGCWTGREPSSLTLTCRQRLSTPPADPPVRLVRQRLSHGVSEAAPHDNPRRRVVLPTLSACT